MKLHQRHVKAVAVCGIALVLLTGARGSHGGGCGKSDSDSSDSSDSSLDSSSTSTSTGGFDSTGGTTTSGSTGDSGLDDLDDVVSGGTSSSSTSSTGSTTSGGIGGNRNRDDAMSDIRISECAYSDALGITATLEATNSTSDTVTYDITVEFTDENDATIATRNPTMPLVGAGETDTLDVSTPYVPDSGSTGSGECKVTDVSRQVS